jgi:lysophospholipase L1-like esterase
LVALSSSLDHPIVLDKLIAVTGWTTDELATAIEKERPSFDYDLVTLLIGVNNQYRGRSIDEYAWQFYSLVCQAILFAKAEAKNVIVLSIPDWGLTPFNTERDKDVTSKEIDAFNAINKKTALELGCRYIDITGSTREHAEDLLFLAEDGLHYSEKEYQLWAKHIISLL